MWRLIVVCVLLAGAAGCEDVRLQPVKPTPVPVLVFGSPQFASVQTLAELIDAQSAADPAKAVRLEYLPFNSDDAFREALRQMQAEGVQYRAYASVSQTYARVAQLQDTRTPIVFAGINDPESVCLVDSLLRPGRNATGYMHFLREQPGKMLQVLLDGFPQLDEVIVLVSGHNMLSQGCLEEDPTLRVDRGPCEPRLTSDDVEVEHRIRVAPLKALAAARGVELRFAIVCRAEDWTALLRTRPASAAWGLFVPWHQLFLDHAEELARFSRNLDVPTIFPSATHVGHGGLMSLEVTSGHSPIVDWHWSLQQVLSGRDPSTLPVMRPRGLKLTLSAGAAGTVQPRPTLALIRRAEAVEP